MSRIFHAVRSLRRASLGAALVVLLVPASASSAGGSAEIEGVWSFNGGAVDIVAVPGGKYEGIVTVQTQFASCAHRVQEHMWTDITPQPDGSYWGLHQWFHGAPECVKNPQLGPTAWRVLHESNGARYLRVCFSDPGAAQPTISPTGAPAQPSENAAYHVTYGCVSSELIAPLPVVQSTGSGSGPAPTVERLTLPSAKQCLRPRKLRIRLAEPKYDPFKTVAVIFRGHKLATSHRGNYVVATLNLAHLKQSKFAVKVRATTLLGHKLAATRTYRICKKARRHRKRHKKG